MRPAEVTGNPGAARDERAAPFLLSPRQRTCLVLAAAGMTERDMGRELGLATTTVHNYLARARERLGARSTTQAVAVAIGRGLIAVEE